jgi:hypothetical protein
MPNFLCFCGTLISVNASSGDCRRRSPLIVQFLRAASRMNCKVERDLLQARALHDKFLFFFKRALAKPGRSAII